MSTFYTKLMKAPRRADLWTATAWLVLVAFSTWELGPVFLGLGLGVLACYLFVRVGLPRLRSARRAVLARTAPLHVFQLASAGERYGTRAPVPLLRLARALENLGVGAVEVSEGCVRVTRPTGERAEIRAPEAGASIGNVRLKATTTEWAVLCCDALAPTLGPMRFAGGGIELVIDGTVPRSELESEVHKLLIARARALRDAADATTLASGDAPGTRYLN